MKKLILIATSWMILSSCAKNVKTPDEANATQAQAQAAQSSNTNKQTISNAAPERATARLVFTRPGPQGGYGWVLYIARDEFEVPANLPQEFQKENIYVDVTFYKTDKPVENWNEKTPKYYVSIQEIRRVKVPSPDPTQ